MDASQLPALVILVPLIASIFCAFLRRGPLAWLIATIATWALPVICAMLVLQVLNEGSISYAMGGWEPPWGIEYRVDIFSGFILLLISGISAVIMPYALTSVASEIDKDNQAWFYTLYLLCLCGLLGIVITGDAFNAFVFLEVSSLATYTLIALGKDRRALVAAYQYLVMGTIGATFYVIGIGLLYSVTGTLNFVDLAQRIGDVETTRPIVAALAFLTVGISLKLALFPLHAWLPNAYTCSPSFVTAFLAATATKTAVYLLIRFYFSIFDFDKAFQSVPVAPIIVALSVAAMFGASIVAIYQDNIKRMLAYSSVAQMGYITVGVALANQAGLTGGIVHIFNHAVIKCALFLAVGAVFYRVGSTRLEDLAGIGRRMPITMGCFVVAGLSIIGIPGTAGFIGKWYLALGALDREWWWLVFMLVASSLLALIYIGKVVEVAWFRSPTGEVARASDAPATMTVPLIVLAIGTVYFGIDASLSADLAGHAVNFLLGGAR